MEESPPPKKDRIFKEFYKFFKKIFGQLETHSSLIQALASCVIVFLTFSFVGFNHSVVRFNDSLLQQQKNQEYIQFRAYLQITDAFINTEAKNSVTFILKNGGLTPSKILSMKTSVFVNNKEEMIVPNISQTLLAPGGALQFVYTNPNLHLDSTFESGSPNYLYNEILFEDYKEQKHKLVSNYQTHKDEQGQYHFSIITVNEFDIK